MTEQPPLLFSATKPARKAALNAGPNVKGHIAAFTKLAIIRHAAGRSHRTAAGLGTLGVGGHIGKASEFKHC